MDLDAIAEEIGTVLNGTLGLRVPAWGVESVEVPAALVALPERIEYDGTYGRGTDQIPDLPLVILVGAPEERASRKRLSQYSDGAGPSSIKQVLEGHSWTTCDEVNVANVDFDQGVTYAGVTYLAAIFHLDVIGSGTQ
jgi:hypothetical protein